MFLPSRGLSYVSLILSENNAIITNRYPWFASAFNPGQGPRLTMLPLI
jgi:hypothetical protein